MRDVVDEEGMAVHGKGEVKEEEAESRALFESGERVAIDTSSAGELASDEDEAFPGPGGIIHCNAVARPVSCGGRASMV